MWDGYLEMAGNALQEGVIITDGLLYVSYINDRGKTLLGLSDHESLGKPLSLLDKVFIKGIKCLEENKAERNVVFLYKGEHLNVSFIPLTKARQEKALAIIISDLTTHQTLKSQSHHHDFHFDALDVLMNSTNEWYVVCDENAIITAMSMAYKVFVGDLSPEGKHVSQVIENTRLHQVIATGEPEYSEVQMIRGNKMIASRMPIIQNGKVVGAVGKAIFKDIEDLYTLFNKVQKNHGKISIFVEPGTDGSTAKYSFESIGGTSQATEQAKTLAKKAAKTDSNVLIVGPSGTGKELFAHAIHHASNRRMGPFIMINCAAIPSELLESELFGYEQGAFTGANRRGHKGRFEMANKGTIFLDEIGDMPLDMQAKLLRVLQAKEVDRVGGDAPIPIDVRVIAATNKTIEALVDQQVFRTDLYYRLNVMRINLAPLNQRKEEIPVLADDILRKLANRMGLVVHGFSPDAIQVLSAYEWPGNVRELENILERALNLMEDDLTIRRDLFPDEIKLHNSNRPQTKPVSLNDQTEHLQKSCIEEALISTNGNKKKAAEMLGMSRAGLYKKLKAYGLTQE